MLQVKNTKDNIDEFVSYFVKLFDYEKYPNLNAKYQFVFLEEGKTYEYYISISNSIVSFNRGKIDEPDITITTPLCVWYDISNGKLSGTKGYLTGKYKVKGKFSLLTNLLKIFGRKFTEDEIPGISDKIAPYEIKKLRLWKKPQKVVVINGSARGKNGHTYLYLKHFIEGMKSAGAFVEEIDIYDANIKITPCLGCEACWSKNQNKCVLNDDANSIIEKINNAYLTIWAFPLFVDSVPAKVKALLDRFFVTIRPVFVPFKNITRHPLYIKKERYIALFSVCGFPEISHLFPLKETFKHISQNCHAPIIANILRPSSQFLYKNPGCKFYLEKVFKNLNLAGREIVEKGKINKKVLENIQSDFGIPKETWLNYSNMYWRNNND